MPLSPPDFYKPLRLLALILSTPSLQFTISTCNGRHQIFVVWKVLGVQNSSNQYCNMPATKTYNSWNAKRWETPYEGGDVCRTCFLRAELQVAMHVIRCRQPHMLAVLDSALTAARTIAHRVVCQDRHLAIERGAARSHIWPDPCRVFGHDTAHGLSRAFQQNQTSSSNGRTV